jgi:hypothetical protein
MKSDKSTQAVKNIDDEIQYYINKKKDENSALKKLLSALENAKKNIEIKNQA